MAGRSGMRSISSKPLYLVWSSSGMHPSIRTISFGWGLRGASGGGPTAPTLLSTMAMTHSTC